MSAGLIIAAPTSGSGKTTITLGVLRGLARRGIDVRGAKSGPDYIDTRFHEAACGRTCYNLDAWAMDRARLLNLAQGDGALIIEGAMGLFDGAPPTGKGATADLARHLNLPVVLVVDASHMAQSVAPLVNGFSNHDPETNIAGIILNRVGSPRHEAILRAALIPVGIPVLGVLYRQADLGHPSRHLGLIPAEERPDLDSYLDRVADVVEKSVDIDAVLALASGMPEPGNIPATLSPPAQSIAIAKDQAFAFAYPHLLHDWRNAGAELSFFSPLNDEAPQSADMVFLPGGYPELHAGTLACAQKFRDAMKQAAETGTVYGECGGYMVMGDGMIDGAGKRHAMLGLLSLETSFAARKLHLGYRHLIPLSGPFSGAMYGHEFHYATTLRADGQPLFEARDADGNDLSPMGLVKGRICGSFAHVIDQVI